MKVTINQTAASLDPAATSSDPETSLKNYIAELSAEIVRNYPDAEIEHNDVDDAYSIIVGDDPDGSIADEIQRMSETVYEVGNFWA